MQEQELPHSTVGAEAPAQVLVHAPRPQRTAEPTQAAASQSKEHEASPHMRPTSPQASTPSEQVTAQASSGGQTIVAASQASSP